MRAFWDCFSCTNPASRGLILLKTTRMSFLASKRFRCLFLIFRRLENASSHTCRWKHNKTLHSIFSQLWVRFLSFCKSISSSFISGDNSVIWILKKLRIYSPRAHNQESMSWIHLSRLSGGKQWRFWFLIWGHRKLQFPEGIIRVFISLNVFCPKVKFAKKRSNFILKHKVVCNS